MAVLEEWIVNKLRLVGLVVGLVIVLGVGAFYYRYSQAWNVLVKSDAQTQSVHFAKEALMALTNQCSKEKIATVLHSDASEKTYVNHYLTLCQSFEKRAGQLQRVNDIDSRLSMSVIVGYTNFNARRNPQTNKRDMYFTPWESWGNADINLEADYEHVRQAKFQMSLTQEKNHWRVWSFEPVKGR